MDSELRLGDPRHQNVAEEALRLWLPSAAFLFEPMSPGRSGAELTGVDISGQTGDIQPGTYVLRVGPAEDGLTEANELAAHQRIRDRAPDFAEHHIPRLVRLHQRTAEDGRLVASLHQLAGGSHRYAPPRSQSESLLRGVEAISRKILDAWADPHDVEPMRPRELLLAVAGERRAEECLRSAAGLFGGELHREDGHVFLDPRTVFERDAGAAFPVVHGTCHGDLHTDNLLLPRDELVASDDAFWIVDVDQARRSVAGFDLAYLEVSVLVNILPPKRLPVLARCLEAAEDPAVKSVPDDCHWLVGLLQRSRAGIQEWVVRQPGRLDALYRQFMLARMAAALLWARRFPAGDERARTCLAYAGWYAMRYDRDFPAGAPEFGGASSAVPATREGARETHESARARDELWETFWDAASGFSPHAARYVLVAEQLPRTDSLAALGRIPWSVVVDLDPASDGDGLHHRAGRVLGTQRAVHLLTDDRPVIDYSRGTAWMLAAGSVLRREPALEGRDWVIRRLNGVRQLTASFQQAVGDTPVCVVVLEGGTDTARGSGRDRLLRVIETMDEMLQGKAVFLHTGLARLQPAVPLTHVPLPVPELLERLTGTLGTSAEHLDYTVPALDNGTVAISPETMQKLREYLVILHDGIEASDLPGDDRHNDAFWRGGLIGWADLDEGRDVVRSVNDSLVAALRGSLEHHRTRTVLLEHRPGAGGTTAALRAAWDLHHEYPVAVLPSGIPVTSSRLPLLADRLHLLYTIAQMPVLLVAEAGDLSESYREALYRELSRRNTRVTMLYVRRGIGEAGRGALLVSEPLGTEETADFLGRYSMLAPDPARIEELRLLGTERYERYRTPFFYGLITFEREFTKLSTYVRTHLQNVRGRAREVMQYLALATIFSNTGPQRELVQKLMHVSTPSAELDLSDVLGPEAARLVAVRSGRVRLQHQLLAEQVLAELLNDERWDRHLKDLAIDFIQTLAITTDVSSEPVRVLLRQMFVDRQGGLVDGVEDRRNFAPLIERLDLNSAHQVLKSLTEHVSDEPHFWNHLGRHQMYRLNRELDKAEEYVSRAVALAEGDFLHHHTLGLARRSRMRQALRDAKRRGVQAVMSVADRWFAQTVECFITTRKLNPENIYGYVTHVQAVVDVAKAIKDAARVSSVAELSADASDWVTENLADANFLLAEAAQLYGTLDRRDDYLVRCQADIKRLYGDLDSVVELWELAVAGARGTPMVQRALAQAYYVRGGRSWRELDRTELARIAELARQNLSRTGCKEEDYRLWFEAYRLLPEFDIDEALSQLQLWSDRFPSWRAHYYRYCLFFHLWFTGRSNDVEAFRLEQQQAEKYVVGRSNRSYLWLSSEPQWFPMIADSDLGEWNRREMFWTNTSRLQRVNGVIDFMRGPQAGTIQLHGSVTAFFVPTRGNFLPDSDENTPVNFFLGFSPEGPRAWDVRKGHSDDAVQARRTSTTVPAPLLTARASLRLAPAQVAERAAGLTRRRKTDFCIALLEAWQTVGITPRLSQLAERTGARFRYEGDDVEELLTESRRVVVGDEDDPVVQLIDAAGRTAAPVQALSVPQSGEEPLLGRISYTKEAENHGIIELVGSGWARFKFQDIGNPGAQGPVRGQIVRMAAVELDRQGGMNARGIELMPFSSVLVDGEVVHAEQLRERVEADLRAVLEERLAQGIQATPARELEEWLDGRFTGCRPLAEHLGLPSLKHLWDGLDWLDAKGNAATRVLSLRGGKVFGRVSESLSDGGNQDRRSTEPDRFGEVLESVVEEIRKKTGKSSPAFYRVRKALLKRLGEDYHNVVGNSLKHRIAQQRGWELLEIGPKKHLVRRTGTASPARKRKDTEGARGTRDAPEAFPSLLAGAVASLSADGKPATLQQIGALLRARLGENYTAVVGSSLKRRIEKEPGWRIEEVRHNTLVAHPPPEVRGGPPAAGAADVAVDVAADLEEAVRTLRAKGREAALTGIGDALHARWGPEEYKRIVGGRLRTLVEKHGWTVREARQGVWVLDAEDRSRTTESEG
ncbi:hypothetical protein [Streptomyces pini]|uniref:Phosphotransferase enzyme family protein n=1 Tax=Streptomyces pini TaxID=1520580 RepID=A0A1I3UGI6_9ACTN|nr:hypothetical protein [Streptomyces pini]SFJ80976.1 hypothetical protein SAMN05192584_101427 [Streptomyces pini]